MLKDEKEKQDSKQKTNQTTFKGSAIILPESLGAEYAVPTDLDIQKAREYVARKSVGNVVRLMFEAKEYKPQ